MAGDIYRRPANAGTTSNQFHPSYRPQSDGMCSNTTEYPGRYKHPIRILQLGRLPLLAEKVYCGTDFSKRICNDSSFVFEWFFLAGNRCYVPRSGCQRSFHLCRSQLDRAREPAIRHVLHGRSYRRLSNPNYAVQAVRLVL